MQFTFKREAAVMTIFWYAPFLLGLLVAVLLPLFLR
jgi:hypothetical protein